MGQMTIPASNTKEGPWLEGILLSEKRQRAVCEFLRNKELMEQRSPHLGKYTRQFMFATGPTMSL